MKKMLSAGALASMLFVAACGNQIEQSSGNAAGSSSNSGGPTTTRSANPNDKIDYSSSKLETIYLAGGCFWGVEAYMERIPGVQDVTSGYANGEGENPTYEDVTWGNRKFAETVEVKYDPTKVSLSDLLVRYFRIINPISVNKQGNDVGIQYRTGIYYSKDSDLSVINAELAKEQKKYDSKIVTEILPITNYYLAEEEHQDYLEKNPDGYCHVDLAVLDQPLNKD